jgi:hypothetical protein
MIAPPCWTEQQLDTDRLRAIEHFRDERMREPLEAYLAAFEEYRQAVEALLEDSRNLLDLDERAISILTDPSLLEAFRYLAGPPISADDLETLADAVLSPGRLKSGGEMAHRVVAVVRTGLDARRFPWVAGRRAPTREERGAAILASAALMASSHVSAARRNEGKTAQELMVEEALLKGGFRLVERRAIDTFNDAPGPGEFCRESRLGVRKADFVLSLWDRRVMAIECKVSNSSVNSVKRLNNDAAAKAEAWVHDFGAKQMVPAAVLSGVFKLHNLVDAQGRGLALFWAHDLSALVSWIGRTKPR